MGVVDIEGLVDTVEEVDTGEIVGVLVIVETHPKLRVEVTEMEEEAMR